MAVSADVKLDIYNRALLILGSRALASLSEAREPRRVLDEAWGSGDNAVLRALEEADWNFATKAVEGVVSPSVTPYFGFRYAFGKPDDLRRLTALSASPTFARSMDARDYVDEAGYWYTNYGTIYVRYISDHTDYGLDSSKWTEHFKEYLAASLAERTGVRITNDEQAQRRIMYVKDQSKKQARGNDAMDEGHKPLPHGSWVTSRSSRHSRENG